MKTNIILRENHKECMDKEADKTYQVYTEHYNSITSDFKYISNLLKDIEGELILQKVNDSWFDYEIKATYKNQVFSIGQDRKHKLSCHVKDFWQYQHLVHNEIRKTFEANKPLNYSFDKLTTKKLIQVLDYYIDLLGLCKKLSDKKEIEQLEIYDNYVKGLKYISEAIDEPVKEHTDNNSKQVYIYAPFGRIEVIYNFTNKETTYSYDIDKYIELIKIKID